MVSRSCVPKWIKRGIERAPKGKGSNQHMNFKKGSARKKRPDTGKKITKSHHTPN